MDSSISHDPFAPDDTTGGAAEPTTFREFRFRSVGATEEEIAAFRADFDELDPDEQAANNIVIDEADDAQMVKWLEQSRAEDAETVEEVAESGEEGPEKAATRVSKAAEEDSARSLPKKTSASARRRPRKSS